MAVTEFNVLAKGNEPSIDRDRSRTWTLVIEAITDSATDDFDTVVGTVGFPRQFVSTHPNDPEAFCVSVKGQQHEDDATYWELTYTYKTAVPEFAQGTPDGTGQSDPQHSDDPLDRAPQIRLYTRMIKVPTFFDYNGNGLINSAGSPYETWNRELPILVIDARKNVSAFLFDNLNDIVGSVNDAEFRGWEKRRVKCETLEASPKFDKGFYWDLHGQIAVGRTAQIIDTSASIGGSDGWWFDWKLNAGYEIWDAIAGKLRPIIMPGGQRPSRPQPLNAAGTAVINLRNGVDRPVWNAFRICPDANFAPLDTLLRFGA